MMTVQELNKWAGTAYSEDDGEMWLTAAWRVVEDYLDRPILFANHEQEFIMDGGNTVLLRAFPIATDTVTVTLDGEPFTGWIAYRNGVLQLNKRIEHGTLMVSYDGGYPGDGIPEPIKMACAMVARSMSTAIQNGGQTIQTERLDSYSVTYAQTYTGTGLDKIAPAAGVLLEPYRVRGHCI